MSGSSRSQEAKSPSSSKTRPQSNIDMDEVELAVRGIRYGEVRVLIQDGVIVQIERVEKRRLR